MPVQPTMGNSESPRRRPQFLRALLWAIAVLPAMPTLGQEVAFEANPDPLIEFNRAVFGFNEYLDGVVLRPLAIGYTSYIPSPVQTSISNFFANVDDVNTFANNLLQWKVADAVSDCGRILINTTVGIGGLFDVASELGLEKHREDFGQTLAVWGVPPGPFVVLPIFGASTVRDSFGLGVDSLLNPLYQIEDEAARAAAFGMERVEWRTGLLPMESLYIGDRYIFTREAHLQSREFEASDGQVEDLFGDF